MITRFAPSPTGPLHLGHAYSAMFAHDMAKAAGGTFLLRIEDIDQSRARPEWEEQIYDDLAWLGLSWQTPVRRQSDHLSSYFDTIDHMWWDKLLYVCQCNRKDIRAALSAPQEGDLQLGPDGLIYPGTCRNDISDRDHYPVRAPRNATLRLDLKSYPDGLSPFSYMEKDNLVSFSLTDLQRDVGDIVIGRKDSGTSYHLSVVLDDAVQGVTDVVRGADLSDATQIHVAFQKLLNLPTPRYYHHKLIRDEAGKRLAKRDDARAISTYRSDGATPNDIRQLVGLPQVK